METMYQYYKAKEFKDNSSMCHILWAKTPREAKSLGRRCWNFNEDRWTQIRYDIMLAGLKAKFQQNDKLRLKLLQTAGTVIAETNPFDRILGIGLALTDPKITQTTAWLRSNLLGKALMQTRDFLSPKTIVTEAVDRSLLFLSPPNQHQHLKLNMAPAAKKTPAARPSYQNSDMTCSLGYQEKVRKMWFNFRKNKRPAPRFDFVYRKTCVAWLIYMENVRCGSRIIHCRNNPDHKIAGHEVDGVSYGVGGQTMAYLYLDCFAAGDNCIKTRSQKHKGKTLDVLQQETRQKCLDIRAAGAELVTVYKCQFWRQAQGDKAMHNTVVHLVKNLEAQEFKQHELSSKDEKVSFTYDCLPLVETILLRAESGELEKGEQAFLKHRESGGQVAIGDDGCGQLVLWDGNKSKGRNPRVRLVIDSVADFRALLWQAKSGCIDYAQSVGYELPHLEAPGQAEAKTPEFKVAEPRKRRAYTPGPLEEPLKRSAGANRQDSPIPMASLENLQQPEEDENDEELFPDWPQYCAQFDRENHYAPNALHSPYTQYKD